MGYSSLRILEHTMRVNLRFRYFLGIYMKPFKYLRPTCVSEVASLLAEYGTEARLLAGGTDLTVGLRHGAIAPKVVIDIKKLTDLRQGLKVVDGQVRISATAVLTELIQEPIICQYFPGLVEAAIVVGSQQIRNRATLIGNICNASPAADTVPALVVSRASVVIYGPEGERTVKVVDFIKGNRSTDLGSGEFVTEVILPIPATAYSTAFGRITRRRGVDLATVNLCCGVDESGQATLAFGAASPRPLVVTDTAGIFSNIEEDRGDRLTALDCLMDKAKVLPISDVRASAEYRMAMLKVLAERALLKARERVFG